MLPKQRWPSSHTESRRLYHMFTTSVLKILKQIITELMLHLLDFELNQSKQVPQHNKNSIIMEHGLAPILLGASIS